MSGPTPDDVRAIERTLMHLRAAAASAVDGGDRQLSLEVARGFRDLYSSSVRYGSESQERVRTAMEKTRATVVQWIGTAAFGWLGAADPSEVTCSAA